MSATVATADEVARLEARIAELEAAFAKLAQGAAIAASAAPVFLTAKQVAARFRIDTHRVYDALALGKLEAEKRDGGGNRSCTYRITPAAADAWYARFERGAR